MATSGVTSDAPAWRYLPVALALILPILACVGWTWLQANSAQRLEGETTARIVLAQTESILTQSHDMLERVTEQAGKPCAEVLPALQRWGTLNPYFRSLVLLRKEQVYCSSAVGPVSATIDDFSRWNVELSPDRWQMSVTGTPLAPDRPAILLGKSNAEGNSGMVVVDGRYVQDLLNAVATMDDLQLELIVGGKGAPIRSDSWGGAAARAVALHQESADEDDGVALTVNVLAPPENLVRAWSRSMATYLPVALLLGVILALGTHRLQASRRSFREQLRRAMRAGEFLVHYQPVYSQATSRCEGVEALMRWERPGIGPVRPDVFIAQAETDGMIIELTQHLLRLIERDMRTWTMPPHFHIAVNIAAEHLSSAELLPDVQAFAAQVAASQPLVVLEITERSLITDNGQARRNIDALRAQGVRVAIDDFGTGHCSLSYLQKFPVDYLKVDQGFVQAIGPAGEEAPVLDAIITLAHRLGLSVVAEGVETGYQFDYLKARGVAFIQGYLFARPMPSAELLRWYAGHQQPGAAAWAA
ncbi:putative cyclic di-GMP phosphodiesterase PdeN [Achromobacter anxifer]|jgi:sensor c-di-GMP phosphodiesterase-like protein|uniref:cyclic-guanylate-specific phosphodiesterase n=1 Tax=Achromobacter anxifer TaxID=1287737 RepID=A0A6S7CXL3_9BURK|nr:cyclic diguanylate phosphodiesterase [Achromobacter anxifer]MDF8359789.1 cyclic diguanylate phosphodiesterase [Achromobacter anxifer]CAB3866673.1 putative cyclic di-GMP phosphodiesterase PdeN [Achromobacter anxifer]